LTVPMLRRGTLAISRFDTSSFVAMFSFGIPLVVNEVAYVFLDAADRALVQRYLGATELGMYAVAYGLASMIQGFLMTPLNLAVLPMYMRLWSAGEREKTINFLSTGLDLLILGSAGLFAVVSATAHDLVILSASSKYVGADELIPPIFAGLLIFTSYFFVNAGLMIGKKTARIAGVMAASAVVNIALNCALLPHMGLRGAALATVLSYAFCIGLMALVSFRELPLRIGWKHIAGYGIATAAALTGSALVHPKAALVSAVTKAAVSAAIYSTVLFLIDPRVRRMASVLTVWMEQRKNSRSTPGSEGG
jgi:O-antigen/teichoic acid export membrane protein